MASGPAHVVASCERHIYQCSGVAVTVGGWQNGTVKSGSVGGHYQEQVSLSQCCIIAVAVEVVAGAVEASS